MKQTTNYKLNKPDPEDYYNINDQNANMDVIDTELSGRAQKNHQHGAGDIASGTLPVERGGTGQASLSAARNAMGLGNTTGALPVANGGTGAATAAGARQNIGATWVTSLKDPSLADVVTRENIFANPPLNRMGDIYVDTFSYESGGSAATYKTPLSSNSAEFWTVLTLADFPNRAMQIATQIYSGGGAARIFVRTRHIDNNDYTQWQDWREIFTSNTVVPVTNGGTGQASAGGVAKLASLLPAQFANPSRLTAHYNTFLSTGLSNESVTISQLADLVPARTAFWFRNNTNETPGVTDVPYVSSEILFDKGANNNYCYAVAFSCNGDTAESNHGEVSVWSKNTLREYGWRRLFDDKGVIPIANGGTGASDAAGALTNLEARPLVEKLIPLGTDILSLAPGVYYVDGVNTNEMTAAMNLPANMWHWHILVYSDRNTTSQEYNYKLILAFPSSSKRFYINMMSYDGAWTGWSNIYTSGDKPTLGELGISVQSAAPSSPKAGDLWVW